MEYSYSDFNPVPAQLQAIVHPPGPLLIIAGAGTGKTATILHRIRYHTLSEAMKPEHCLILTFTERATRELQRKIARLDIPNFDQITISTFHAFCFGIVQDYGLTGNQTYSHLDDFGIAYLLLKRYDELSFLQSEFFRTQPRQAVFSSFIPFFSRLRDELISPDEITALLRDKPISEENIHRKISSLSPRLTSREAYLQFQDLIAVYQQYQRWKQKLHLLDYGDMVLQSWRLLQTSSVLTSLRQRFQDIIIDEYQDNNYALNKIINHLVAHDPRLTVVGDEDQCIYSFRGANYYNINDFKNRYQDDPRYRIVTLETNFRSTQPILDVANRSIANDPGRTPKNLVAARQEDHPPLPVLVLGSKTAQLAELIHIINRCRDNGYSYEALTVLCRTSSQVDDIVHRLKQNALPVNAFRDRLNGIPEIRLLTAWTFVLNDNPRFSMAFQHLRQSYCPDVPISLPDMDTLQKLDLSTLPTAAASLLRAIRSIAAKIHQHARPDEVLWNILKESQLLAATKHHYRYRDRLSLRNIGKLLSHAENFTATHPAATFEDWQLYYDLLINQDRTLAEEPQLRPQSGIQVMTIHMAKGLQFPIVIIPFLQAQSFPLNYNPDRTLSSLPDSWFHWSHSSDLDPKAHHINEERRIFYVAVTRAEHQLYLLGPASRTSLFLKEIGSETSPVLKKVTAPAPEDKPMLQSTSQRLLQELHQEIEANQPENILALTQALNDLVTSGEISAENPYAYLNPTPETVDRRTSNDVLRLSASAVEEYLQCPYKYRLSHIDQVPQRKSSAQMTFGSIIHHVLQDFHNTGQETEQQLYDLLDKHWQKDVFEYQIREEEFYKQAREMLANYWQYQQSMESRFLAAEKFFEFEIPEWDISINGKIDRIDERKDGLLVIDYKTGKQPERDTNKKSLQLALYTEALNRNAIKEVKGRPAAAQLLYLKNLDELHPPHSFSKEEIEKHLNNVKEAADGIRANTFPVKPGQWTCSYCDYKEFLCPAWEND